MSILKDETSVQEAARKHSLTVAEVEDWKERFLAGAEHYSPRRRRVSLAPRSSRARGGPEYVARVAIARSSTNSGFSRWTIFVSRLE